MSSTPSPSMSENIRLTITVTPEVHAAFLRLSKASNKSISKAMGEWLGDTLEAAEFLADTLERARSAPRLVVQELQAYTLGLSDELSSVMDVVRLRGKAERAKAAAEGPRSRGVPAAAVATGEEVPNPPRPVIRGGKSRQDQVTKPSFPLPPAQVQAYADTNGVRPRKAK